MYLIPIRRVSHQACHPKSGCAAQVAIKLLRSHRRRRARCVVVLLRTPLSKITKYIVVWLSLCQHIVFETQKCDRNETLLLLRSKLLLIFVQKSLERVIKWVKIGWICPRVASLIVMKILFENELNLQEYTLGLSCKCVMHPMIFLLAIGYVNLYT